MERKVSTQDLKLGMYIAQLDRPWLDTPFLFQGFHIKEQKDIKDLQQYCQFVFIDEDKGEKADRYLDNEPAAAPAHAASASNFLPPRKIQYRLVSDLECEMQAAKQNQERLDEQVSDIMETVRNGGKINIEQVKDTLDDMIESIVRNPDAYMWLRRMKNTDDYLYNHAIDVSVLAVAFGRHLGLEKSELNELAVGTLLFDVGKTRIPSEILCKPEKLTDKEFQLVRRHVEISAEIMMQTEGISDVARTIALTHHERHNGNGYPQRLRGTQIPVFGRIAAIVDCYDAIISNRPYCRAISAHEAIVKLYEWRNIDFQEDLVEQFIQCLGVYPTGTIVEMTTGEVGIVLAQNPVRRLRPKVMLVLDENKKPYSSHQVVDLLMETSSELGSSMAIKQALEKGAYGIDPRQFFL